MFIWYYWFKLKRGSYRKYEVVGYYSNIKDSDGSIQNFENSYWKKLNHRKPKIISVWLRVKTMLNWLSGKSLTLVTKGKEKWPFMQIIMMTSMKTSIFL